MLSPDGRRLLTICHRESPIPVWDGNRAAEALKNGATATLWDSTKCQRISVLTGHAGQLNDAIFSPDGQMVLTGGADKTARLWSMAATLDTSGRVHWWDLKTFVQIGPPCKSTAIAVTDELVFRFIQREVAILDGFTGMGLSPGWCYIRGLESGIEFPGIASINSKADDDCVIDPEGRVYDLESQRRRFAPAGRKFSEELARFATEKRFIVLNVTSIVGWPEALIDLYTEKGIGNKDNTQTIRYVPSRRTFLSQNWPSPRYVPIQHAPLDAEVARLFAEVVTCHELDPAGPIQLLKESEWNERRRTLVARLNEHPAPFVIQRLAADRWFWLRRQLDRAKTDEEKLKYLDRLIAVEPAWRNYDRRATEHAKSNHFRDATLDAVAAGKRAGGGYWQKDRTIADPLLNW